MNRRALLPFLLLALMGGAQAAVLHGTVLTDDGVPAVTARLSIVDHAPELALGSVTAAFDQPLNGSPAQVVVTSLVDSIMVLYPPDGRVPVPASDDVSVVIVVGKPDRVYIQEILAGRLVHLETLLAGQNVEYNAVNEEISSTLAQILATLELKESDLRRDVEFKRGQALATPEILQTVATYVRRLRDLRSAFKQCPPGVIEKDRQMLDLLHRVLGEYNTAYSAFADQREAFKSRILTYWPEPRGELVAGDLERVYLEANERIHRSIILPLSEGDPAYLVDIQRVFGDDPPSKDEARVAARKGMEAADRIEASLIVLDQLIAQLNRVLAVNG